MARINSRTKGAQGEREAAKWLQELLDLEELPQRNLEQVRSGGEDLKVGPFIIEVKRVENLNKRKAWVQVCTANCTEDLTPVVLFRKNRQPWRCLVSASYLGLVHGYVELDTLEARSWLKMKYIEWKCLRFVKSNV